MNIEPAAPQHFHDVKEITSLARKDGTHFITVEAPKSPHELIKERLNDILDEAHRRIKQVLPTADEVEEKAQAVQEIVLDALEAGLETLENKSKKVRLKLTELKEKHNVGENVEQTVESARNFVGNIFTRK